MQHGSILLAQSETTPSLPGIRELVGVELSPFQLTEAIISAFASDTGWGCREEDWKASERQCVRELVLNRYLSPEWNERR
jgi:lipoate-protein ligase A